MISVLVPLFLFRRFLDFDCTHVVVVPQGVKDKASQTGGSKRWKMKRRGRFEEGDLRARTAVVPISFLDRSVHWNSNIHCPVKLLHRA